MKLHVRAAKESGLLDSSITAWHIEFLRPVEFKTFTNIERAWAFIKAINKELGRDYRFETTLGGRSITRLLQSAARGGNRLHIWFCGLESPELHLQRLRARVMRGGHDIPEAKIRERWDSSRENLIRLLPSLHHLRLYDNSAEADPALGQAPQPRLLLEVIKRKITAPSDLSNAPEWAQPIIAAAIHLHRAML